MSTQLLSDKSLLELRNTQFPNPGSVIHITDAQTPIPETLLQVHQITPSDLQSILYGDCAQARHCFCNCTSEPYVINK